jgi:hypothetical protein
MRASLLVAFALEGAALGGRGSLLGFSILPMKKSGDSA